MKLKILIIFLILTTFIWSDIQIQSGVTVTLDNNAQIVVDGSWDNAGTFESPTGLVTMSGSGAATFSASGDNNFYQLLINKPPTGTFTLNSSLDVNNLLTVAAGSIITGANTIIMGASGYVIASPLLINGNITGYPVTVGTSSYNNSILGVELTAGNNIGDLEVLLFITPTGLTEFPTILNKWSLNSTNPPVGRDLTLSWNLSEDNGIDLNSIQVWKSPDDGTTWFQVGAPTTTSGNPRSITLSDITALSDWTIGEPIFSSTTEDLDFGVCTLSSTQSQQITITNESSSTISGTATISTPYSVSISTDDGGFSVPESRAVDANETNSRRPQTDDLRNVLTIPSISASGSVTLQITYNPLTTGTHDDVLLLSFSGTGSPSKEIIVTGTTVATPEIQVTPLSIAYGDVYVGDSSTDQFTIENTGSGILTGNISTPTGYSVAEATGEYDENDVEEYKQNLDRRSNRYNDEKNEIDNPRNSLAFSIDPGSSATYDLTFSPSSTGNINGSVIITNNAGSDETISVTGRGVTVVAGTDPTSFTETIQRENSSSDVLQISNSSNGLLTYTASISYLDDNTRTINTVNPSSVDYWTGTCASGVKTQTSEVQCKGNSVVANRETGWMKFDISSLPDDAIVYSIEFHGYVNDTNYPYWSITPCLDDPVSTDAATLSTNINANTGSTSCYNYLNESNTYSEGWKTYILGGNALVDFENGLADDWFAVGIAERDSSPSYYVYFDGWNESNPPYLEIEYTTPDKNWLTIDNAMRVQGSVSGTSYNELAVDFNSAGISDGTYSANINVASNDPVTPSIDIAVSLTVQTPEITVSPVSVDYGYKEVGTTSTQQFTIQNTGNALLEGYITTPSGFTVSLASDGDSSSSRHNLSDREINSNSETKNSELQTEADEISEFETDNRATVYYSVVAGETNTYNLNFAPIAVADYSGIISISDNCPVSDFSISVSAHGDEPDLDVTPSLFNITLANFETTTEALTLSNTSNVEVNYTAFIYTETVVPISSALWTGTVNWSTYTDNSEVRGHYDEDGWMMFDISSIPDNATILGAIFHGYVNSSYAPALSLTPISTPPPGTPPVTLHNDIVYESNNPSICYIYENQQLIPTGWYEDELAGSATADIQSALTQDWFALGICERTNNPAYFINFDGWNETNPPFINIVYTLPTELDPWLTIDDDTAVTGSIPSLDNVVHTMGFDPSLVGDGTYTTNILIISNDADEREQLIPVTLTVETPVITVDPSSIDFGDILVGEISTDQFTIENTGTATLSGSITTPAGYSAVLAETDNSSSNKKVEPISKDDRNVLTFDIAVGVTLTYDLTFAPTAVADYNGNVVIAHNALAGSDNIAVTGAGVEPDIDVSPGSFAFSIQEHETSSETLTISNLGGYSLTFSGSVDYNLDVSKKDITTDDIDAWLTLDGEATTGGTVSPGGSIPIILGFDPSGLADATYTAYVNISSDDPDEATVSVQVDMTVSTSGITVSPLIFDFGYIAVGEQGSDQFTIENTGNATLTGSISDLTGFTVTEFVGDLNLITRLKESWQNPTDAVSFSVPALSSKTYDITFAPVSVADYSGVITISQNAASSNVDLQITAFGEIPDIAVSPTSLSKTLPNNETGTEELTISNSGPVDLEYDASIVYLAPDSDLINQPVSGNDVIFDSQYYTDSRQGGEDIASAISIASLPYIGSGTTADYNNDYDEACNFSGSTAPDVVYSYIPTDPELVTIDLCGSSFDTKVYIYENDETTAIACNDDYYSSGDPCGSYVSALFDISLTPGNTYYIVVDGYDTSSGDYDIDVSKKIYSWLTLDNQPSASGSVVQGNPDAITAGFDPDGLPDGTYNANIVINSNDPDEPEVLVPVSLTVATPGIAVSHSTANFGDVIVSQSSSIQFSIENTGTAQLSGDITTPAGYYVLEATDHVSGKSRNYNSIPLNSRNVLSYNIGDGQTAYYYLTFEPPSVGDYLGNVIITHNAGGTDETIAVSGTGVTVHIGLDPTSFSESAYEGNVVNTSLTISNTGNRNLNYSGNVVYNSDALTTVSVYPQITTNWTGTTDGVTFTENSLMTIQALDLARAWAKFDISSIPNEAIIQSVQINLYFNAINYPYFNIVSLENDPIIQTPADVFTDCADGNIYVNWTSSTPGTGWWMHDLGSSAVADLQAQISSNWFGVGIYDTDGAGTYGFTADGWNETNIPYLEIQYAMPGDLWMNLDGSQTFSGTVVPSGSDMYGVQFDTDSLEPDTYSASISISSNDPDNPTFSIPVSFTVLMVLDAPENAAVEVDGSTVTISWDAVPGATLYHVYSSDSPDGIFAEETGGGFDSADRESWSKTYSPIAGKLFFKVTADDISAENTIRKKN